MIVIGATGFVIVRRSAESGALRQAVGLSELAGRGIAEPQITPGVLRGAPVDLARLDRVVHRRLLTNTPIVRVKIWDARGRVIYSDATQLIGSVFPLGADELRTLRPTRSRGGCARASASARSCCAGRSMPRTSSGAGSRPISMTGRCSDWPATSGCG
jgi:hypothetical protein